MRTRSDRIRHAVLFEAIGLVLVTPLGAWAFAMPMHDIGVVAMVSATIAMIWNYGYNVLFDRALLRLAGTLHKTLAVRVLHAVLFEAGLLAVLMPFIAWYLGIGLLLALAMDAGFSAFYLAFAFLFNLAYDRAFPPPDPRRRRET